MAKKKKKKTEKTQAVPIDFEKSYGELENIVRKLEQGQLGLQESLEQYESGVKHLKECYQALEQAEQKIELLTGIDRQGNAKTVPFVEPDESASTEIEDDSEFDDADADDEVDNIVEDQNDDSNPADREKGGSLFDGLDD